MFVAMVVAVALTFVLLSFSCCPSDVHMIGWEIWTSSFCVPAQLLDRIVMNCGSSHVLLELALCFIVLKCFLCAHMPLECCTIGM